MADIITNISFAGFLAILLIGIIRNLYKDIKNSSQSVEDATPKNKKKGL
jgi:hypothetical protein